MNIAMIGSGYVGLVSAACFADFGHNVVCVDNDTSKIEALRKSQISIFEPGLEAIVEANSRAGRLSFTTELERAVGHAEAIFIAVGTPSRRGDGYADLAYVFEAVREIAKAIVGFTVIIAKSTVPVGTGDEIERIIREESPDADFAVVSNPEFLREGAAINDFKRPDRVVVGANDERAREIMREIYRPLHINQGPLFFTDRRTSELIKYASNAFLAMKITYINEIADLCERVGADVQQVARGIGLDNRIGSKFLHAGPGFGGSCFPKDTVALAKTAQDADSPLRLVETVIEVNEQRKISMAKRIIAACGGSVAGKTIAFLGLTFKPNTDDMREAPSLVILPALQTEGARIVAYDPKGHERAKPLLPDVAFASDAYDCVRDADAVVILTEWDAFRALDLKRIGKLLKTPVMIDLRNIYRSDDLTNIGFTYVSVGQ